MFHYNRKQLIASGRQLIGVRMNKKGHQQTLEALGDFSAASPGAPDRRTNCRFPILCEVVYKVLNSGGIIETGAGQTVNISSTGVLFEAEAPLPPGRRAELAISWPIQLNGKCGLKLIAHGRIVRCQGTKVALEIERHEFRTRPGKRAPGSSLLLTPPIPAARGAGVAFMELCAGTRGRYI